MFNIYYRLSFVLLVFVWIQAGFLQNRTVEAQQVNVADLILNIERTASERDILFVDLAVDSRQIREKDGEIEKELQFTFNQLDGDVWRSDLRTKVDENSEVQLVTMRDGDFSFNADDHAIGRFRYGKLGFDQDVQRKLRSSWRNQFPFAVDAMEICGVPLAKYLSAPGLIATWIPNLPPVNGRRVEGINFEVANQGVTTTGELHWLPDHACLMTHAMVMMHMPATRGRDAVNQKLVNTTIAYREYKDRFLPCRVARTFDNGRTITSEITEIREANSDRNFYTAESIGLETPRQPFARWKIWGLIAVVCLAMGIFFRKSGSSRNQKA